jgi:hypothetical protein
MCTPASVIAPFERPSATSLYCGDLSIMFIISSRRGVIFLFHQDSLSRAIGSTSLHATSPIAYPVRPTRGAILSCQSMFPQRYPRHALSGCVLFYLSIYSFRTPILLQKDDPPDVPRLCTDNCTYENLTYSTSTVVLVLYSYCFVFLLLSVLGSNQVERFSVGPLCEQIKPTTWNTPSLAQSTLVTFMKPTHFATFPAFGRYSRHSDPERVLHSRHLHIQDTSPLIPAE